MDRQQQQSDLERDKQYCELCGKMENLLKCGRCRNSFYCSKEHQKQHWKEHKLKCKEADKTQQQKQAEQPARQAEEQKTQDGNGLSKKQETETEQGDRENASLPADSDAAEERQHSTGTPNGQTSSSLKKLALEYIVPCMDKHGMCVVDNFLGVDTGQGILDNVKALHDTGKFTDGQLVSQKSDSTKDIRGDKITWIEGREQGCEKIRFLMSRMDELIRHCNGKLGNYKINGRTKKWEKITSRALDGTSETNHVQEYVPDVYREVRGQSEQALCDRADLKQRHLIGLDRLSCVYLCVYYAVTVRAGLGLSPSGALRKESLFLTVHS
ncbi:hypothetical protein WMY93_018716 [Mugilogobius chulae]|uniref:MYND-type domain-containing protein n=1 Tax=Mugilogobius chulae TaxID=88201 RepID=A0AAW0NPK9_9GOBI